MSPKRAKRKKPKDRVAARPCACGSGERYAACCRRFHRGEEPGAPSQLVRARFSAFALGDGAFVARTAHPDHPQRRASIEELSNAHHRLRYQRLTVHDEAIDGDRAQVLFVAEVYERGADRSFAELSDFVRVDGAWRYEGGVTKPASEAPTRIAEFD